MPVELDLMQAMKAAAVDPRRGVIAKISPEGLAEILAGRVQCLNFPPDGEITAMVCDISSNTMMIRIVAARFPVVPQFELFPDFDLMFRRADVLPYVAMK